MKDRRRHNKLLAIAATVLMVLAVPISLIGFQSVNDIRNRAGEETPLLDFETDFLSSPLTTVYFGIPYEQTLKLTGSLAPIGTISLGCDPSICGKNCPNELQNTPFGFILAADGKTLYWEDPSSDNSIDSWPITISATASSPDDPNKTICVVRSFILASSESEGNRSPSCTLYPPFQPDTVPSGFSVPLRLEASDPDGGIINATVSLLSENSIVETKVWELDNPRKTLFLSKDSTPPLSFYTQKVGTYTFSASVTDADGTTAECKIGGTEQINVIIPGDNGSPEFTSDPYTQSSPGTSINIGQSYSYTLEAIDPDSDTIDYFVINNTGWLTFTVNSTSPGTFKGTFSGTPTAAGSYTAGIALNDSSHNHYSTQLWVINVNYPENDVPIVSITLPPMGTTIENNQTLRIEWQATDHNLIERFNVYLSTDPQNSSAQIPLITDLPYNYNAYLWNVGSTPAGYYYIIVQATDNQSPAATGIGISPPFGISMPAEDIPPVQPVVTGHPTITNLSPRDRSEIEETKPYISADLTAADNAIVKSGSIAVKLDDTNITDLITIEGKDAHETSFMYQQGSPLGTGTHKINVTFTDSSDQVASKTWTFTIFTAGPEPDDSDDDDKNRDTIAILGWKIPKRIAIIVGIGILLLIVALAIPWLFYAAWKGSREEETAYDNFETTQTKWKKSEPKESTPLIIETDTSRSSPSILQEPVYPAVTIEPKRNTVTTVDQESQTHLKSEAASDKPDLWVNPNSPPESESYPAIDQLEATTLPTSWIDAAPISKKESNIVGNEMASEEASIEDLQKALQEISQDEGYTIDTPVVPAEPSQSPPTQPSEPSSHQEPQTPADLTAQQPETKPEEPTLITSSKPPLSPSDL